MIALNFNAFFHKQTVQEPNFDAEEVFFIHSGGVAVCEPTSFKEPILIYGKGGALNIYNVVMDDKLNFKLMAVNEDSYQVYTPGVVAHDVTK